MSYNFVPGEWNNCGAYAEICDADGNVTSKLTCSLECHADPADGSVAHRDPSGLWWRIESGEYE